MTKLKRADKDTLKNVENDEILKLKKLTSSPEVLPSHLIHQFLTSFLVLVQGYRGCRAGHQIQPTAPFS